MRTQAPGKRLQNFTDLNLQPNPSNLFRDIGGIYCQSLFSAQKVDKRFRHYFRHWAQCPNQENYDTDKLSLDKMLYLLLYHFSTSKEQSKGNVRISVMVI